LWVVTNILEAAGSSQMLVPTYEIIWCHIPENHNLKICKDCFLQDQGISEESEQQFYIGITIQNNSKSACANVYTLTCTTGISFFWIFHSGNRNRSTQIILLHLASIFSTKELVWNNEIIFCRRF
jgi:hypothetical protein